MNATPVWGHILLNLVIAATAFYFLTKTILFGRSKPTFLGGSGYRPWGEPPDAVKILEDDHLRERICGWP